MQAQWLFVHNVDLRVTVLDGGTGSHPVYESKFNGRKRKLCWWMPSAMKCQRKNKKPRLLLLHKEFGKKQYVRLVL